MATFKEGQLVRIASKEALNESDRIFLPAHYTLTGERGPSYFKDNPLGTLYRVHYYGGILPNEDCCHIVPVGCVLDESFTRNTVLKKCLVPANSVPIL